MGKLIFEQEFSLIRIKVFCNIATQLSKCSEITSDIKHTAGDNYICVDALRHSQHFFSHVGTFSEPVLSRG